MWTETYHRFSNEAAFLAACDAAGWARGPDGKPAPPTGVVLDIVGPAVEPPVFTGALITPGAVDPRWHVSACWFSGNALPASFVAAEVIPERPVRMFAARDPGQKVAAIRSAFEARKLAKPDDPKLTPITFHDEAVVEKQD
jgi:hypothetical protein